MISGATFLQRLAFRHNAQYLCFSFVICRQPIFRKIHHSSPITSSSSMTMFFDDPINAGVTELTEKNRPGRHWTVDELRRKSNSDIHKLWYVLLIERNMLYTVYNAYNEEMLPFPSPERTDRVQMSMDNIETVIRERNLAFGLLETGDSGDSPTKTVTSFMGFKHKKHLSEHLEPASANSVDTEYETPYLDGDAYMMQKLWKEKEWCKRRNRKDDENRKKLLEKRQHIRNIYHRNQL